MSDILMIEDGVLKKCTDKSATSVTIGEGVTKIERNAFWCCESLESVVIPSSVTIMNRRSFYSCKSLSSIEFSGTVAQWEAVKGKNALLYIPAKSVKCADGEWQLPVLLVEDGKLTSCMDKDATSVVIPSSVTIICPSAFRDCKSITSIEFDGLMAQWEAVKVFSHIPTKVVKCTDGESRVVDKIKRYF